MRATSFCVMLLAMWALSDLASAGTVRVDCTPPTTREDGSALTAAEIAGYELVVTRVGYETTTYRLAGCGVDMTVAKSGSYTAAMITIDTDGLKSTLPSNTVEFAIKASKPNAPGQLRVTTVTFGAGS